MALIKNLQKKEKEQKKNFQLKEGCEVKLIFFLFLPKIIFLLLFLFIFISFNWLTSTYNYIFSKVFTNVANFDKKLFSS
jgi:uncharacterized integral membrane protein